MAAVEVALLLPVLTVCIYCLVEGGNMISAYTDIQECSRQAARLLASDHAPPDITELVRALAPDLEPSDLTATVLTDQENEQVTVEVNYVYRTHITALPGFGAPGSDSFTLKVRTSMPAI